MKKLTMLSLSFFFLFASLAAADSGPNPALDTYGKKLRTGTDYYILPVVRGGGGGLTLSTTNPNGTFACPPTVVQAQREIDNGLALTFTPVQPKKGVVRVSTDLNIKFSAFTVCAVSTVWSLDKYDESTGQYFVTIGGAEGRFKIEELDDDYKLVFCPTVCVYCKAICRDVGTYVDQKGTRRLALSDEPFKVMFKKA